MQLPRLKTCTASIYIRNHLSRANSTHLKLASRDDWHSCILTDTVRASSLKPIRLHIIFPSHINIIGNDCLDSPPSDKEEHNQPRFVERVLDKLNSFWVYIRDLQTTFDLFWLALRGPPISVLKYAICSENNKENECDQEMKFGAHYSHGNGIAPNSKWYQHEEGA